MANNTLTTLKNDENWVLWKQKFQIHLLANNLLNESEERKVAILLNHIGDKGLEIYNTFNIKEQKISLVKLLEKFDTHFIPTKNITIERHRFFTYKQQPHQSFEDYITELTNLSYNCEFKDLRMSLVKDMIIIGVYDPTQKIQEKLLQETDLNLEKAINITQTILLSRKHIIAIEKGITQEDNINYIQNKPQEKYQNKFQKSNNINQQNYHDKNGYQQQNQEKKLQNNRICGKCGLTHGRMCPAWGKQCLICKKYNHFSRACFFKKIHVINNETTIEPEQSQGESTSYFIGSISDMETTEDWSVQLAIFGKLVKFKLDTGADVNIISKNTYNYFSQYINKYSITGINCKIYSFSGERIPIVGKITLKCLLPNNIYQDITFIVADMKCINIIGKVSCSALGLIKRVHSVSQDEGLEQVNRLVSQYSHLFRGLGCIPTQVHLDVNKDVVPIVSPLRRIPFMLEKRLLVELEKMEKDQVIEKITKPTPWVHSIVISEKPNGQLRICLDPRNLNKAILRPHYPFPTFETIRAKLTGAEYFSTLDASSGFWMLPLDIESSDLCTFNTNYGRYKFKRLPYGINSSSEIFHRIMTDIFHDIPGLIIYIDDILIYGSTLESHNNTLKLVLERAEKMNIKFNQSKCKFSLKEVKYLGHIFSKQGIQPDKDKIKAITEMPSPTNTKELQRFLGMINYLGGYIKNLSEETNLLRDLLKKNTQWQWLPNHEQSFHRLKTLICQSPVLIHFDMNKPIRLSVDSSQKALGAVILHNKNPIAFASKSLTTSQSNWAQIEKELYAILFGCERFKQYLYGKKVDVETDHKPLIALFKKPLAEVPSRLQRMMIRLQLYDLNVTYTPGKEMYISDALSRAPIPHSECMDSFEKDLHIHVNLLYTNLAISPTKIKLIQEATSIDTILIKLKKYISLGWPDCKKSLDSLVTPYWNIRDELHCINNIIFKGQSVIIPKSLRNEMLTILHEGHQGIEKTKSLARGIIYWPNMNHDITTKIQQCEVCLMNMNNQCKEPLESLEIPKYPWQRVAIDLFDYETKKYLLVVDYYSNYIEISKLNCSNALTIIVNLKSIFARHGIPQELVSDNGQPFSSELFKNFLEDWEITHITSSPYYPKSNGLAEASVKIIKNILKKCEQSGTDPYLGLLQYRTTPRGTLCSPAQLLMSRSLRTKLPTKISNLKPKIIKYNNYKYNKQRYKDKYTQYYNLHSKKLSELNIDDQILFKKNPTQQYWSKGIIVRKEDNPRSYIVLSENGALYRRNRIHIRINTARKDLNTSPEKILENTDCETRKSVTGPCYVPSGQNDGNKYVTRSGRVVKPPQRLIEEV